MPNQALQPTAVAILLPREIKAQSAAAAGLWRGTMNTATRAIIEATLKLPEADRIRIVAELLHSLSSDALSTIDDEVFRASLDRRLMDCKENPESGISWEELKNMK